MSERQPRTRGLHAGMLAAGLLLAWIATAGAGGEGAVSASSPAGTAVSTDGTRVEGTTVGTVKPPGTAGSPRRLPAGDAKPSGTSSSLRRLPEADARMVTARAPSLLTAVVAPRKKRWEAEHGGFTTSRLAIARRLAGRPGQLLVDRASLPTGREDFLRRVARDTWRGLEAYTDRDSGLVVDNVRIVGGLVPPLALKVGDYTSITNIGLQLISVVAARSLGFVTDADAKARLAKILGTLGRLARHDGFFFNYYDTTSLEPTSSFVSFVDSGWLVAGLVVTRQAFPELADTAGAFLDAIDFRLFYDETTGLMAHGWYASLGAPSTYEYGVFYTEARLASLIAIGKGDVPASHWNAMNRGAPSSCEGRDCPKLEQARERDGTGSRTTPSWLQWRSERFVPSWGGSMFEALMPRLVLDEDRWAPHGLGPNGRAHARVQKAWATGVLGLPVWGMSPCIDPLSGRYREYGVKALGAHGYDEGVVTAHAAALALAVTPDDAADDLMQLAKRYDVYGPFGFYDSVDPSTGRVAWDQLALDQLMIFVSIANHLSGGEIPARFASDPWVRRALPLLADERLFPGE